MTSLHFNSQIESLMATYSDYLKIVPDLQDWNITAVSANYTQSLPPVSLLPSLKGEAGRSKQGPLFVGK